MFNQLDISSFGSFQDFEWRRAVRDGGNNVANLKRLNIIYGRNYSGKTTFSRVFRSMQVGQLPWKHELARFEARGDAILADHARLLNHGLKIRVYNKDFVADNLSILVDQRGGEIKTFAIVGSDNNKIVEEISRLDDVLGSMDAGTGERGKLANLQAHAKSSRLRTEKERAALDEKLRKHANETIKKDRLIGLANYNIDHIRADIRSIAISGLAKLNEEQVAERMALLKQDELPAIVETPTTPANISSLRHEAEELLQRIIVPKNALADLLSDPALQAWVKAGIQHHKGKRDSCAFCRQSLPLDQWQILSNHFSEAVENLEESLSSCLKKTQSAHSAGAWFTLQESQFYPSERAAFHATTTEVSLHYSRYSRDLTAIEAALNRRLGSLFETASLPPMEFSYEAAESAIKALAALVARNEEKTKSLTSDKERARVDLRRDNILKFITTIDLEGAEVAIAQLSEDASAAENAASTATTTVQALESKLRSLELQLKDERKGAQRVNALLSHYFGHDGLQLEAPDDASGQGVRFLITRAGQPAFHLSEGECSLVALCYFVALLEAPESSGEDLVIYIDDPISSLDSNHIYFTFSLIEALIARPAKNADGSNRFKYRQLFVSTHNLDFLKYLKNMSMPDKHHGGTEHFMIERHGSNSSKIALMPRYLKSYVTEFNYLFHQIYLCSRSTPAGQTEEHFYSFGNNLRKFLEAYLYFKYPVKIGSEENFSRIKRFFGDDGLAAVLAGRLSNELSHLGESFDRSVRPIDIPECRTLAKYVLDRIKSADPEQYQSLLESIGAEETSEPATA